jgi:hypothetical protein
MPLSNSAIPSFVRKVHRTSSIMMGSWATLALVVLLGVLPATIKAQIAIGDTFVVRAIYKDYTGMSGGWTEATEVVDSIVADGDTTVYHFSVLDTETDWLFEMGGTMAPLITAATSRLTVLAGKPASIQANSPRFDGLSWILPEKSSFLFHDAIQPIAELCPIPIDSSIADYSDSDFYLVRYADTAGMRWMKNARPWVPGERPLRGMHMAFESAQDTTGSFDSSPEIVFLTDIWGDPGWVPTTPGSPEANPLHLKRFMAICPYHHLDTAAVPMGEGRYGTEILAYRPVSLSVAHDARRWTAGSVSGDSPHGSRFSLLGRQVSDRARTTNQIQVRVHPKQEAAKEVVGPKP